MKPRTRFVTRYDCKECFAKVRNNLKKEIGQSMSFTSVPEWFADADEADILQTLADVCDDYIMKKEISMEDLEEMIFKFNHNRKNLIETLLEMINLRFYCDRPKTVQEILGVFDEEIGIEILYELMAGFDKKMERAAQGRNNAMCAQCCIELKHCEVIYHTIYGTFK